MYPPSEKGVRGMYPPRKLNYFFTHHIKQPNQTTQSNNPNKQPNQTTLSNNPIKQLHSTPPPPPKMCFDWVTQTYYRLSEEGFWPSNYRDSDGRLGWLAPEQDTTGNFLTPIKSTGPYRRGWEACVGCGNENAKLTTGTYKCILYRPNLKVITWPKYTTTTQTASAAFCMAEFSLCPKCRVRADLVMDTSDHLASGSRWESLADHLTKILTQPEWELTREERIAKHDEREALLATLYAEREAFAARTATNQTELLTTATSRRTFEEDW